MKLRSDSGASVVVKKDETTGFARFDGVIAKEGVYYYSDDERVYVPKDVLNDAEANAGFAGLPILIDHSFVDSTNAKLHSVGAVASIPTFKDGQLLTSGVISDKSAIEKVENEGYTQLSPSYKFDHIEEKGEFNGERYTHRQTKRVYMHLALCKNARAGKECSIIFDSIEEHKEGLKLNTLNYKGIDIKFDSKEALEKFKEITETRGQKNDALAIDELQKQLKEAQDELAAATDKLQSLTSEEEKAAAEKEIEAIVAGKLQAIIDAIELSPKDINMDSVKALKFDSNAILAKAVGLTYDPKKHTTDYLAGAVESFKKVKSDSLPERIKSDNEATKRALDGFSDATKKLHAKFYK